MDEKNDDLISRQDAIEAYSKRFKTVPMEYADTVVQFGIDLRELPSAQQWIPCSERLPETEEMMLVTCKAKNGNYTVNRAYYWDKTESWHGTGTMAKVIAWMPLPEPYKEGK